MTSKANTTKRYANKTQLACYKSVETSLGKFVKLLGIATTIVIAIIGSNYFFAT